MTDQHPLTDEVIHLGLLAKLCYSEDDIRTIADWQLHQAIEWLKNNIYDYVNEHYYTAHFVADDFLDDFKKAMRPTNTQENNND